MTTGFSVKAPEIRPDQTLTSVGTLSGISSCDLRFRDPGMKELDFQLEPKPTDRRFFIEETNELGRSRGNVQSYT